MHLLFGLTEAGANVALKWLAYVVNLVFIAASVPETVREASLKTFPTSISTALNYFNLEPKLTLYTVCPKCCKLYPPFDPNLPVGQTHCTWADIDEIVCGAPLFRNRGQGIATHLRPTRRYPYQDVFDWISRLLSRPGIEDIIDTRRLPSGSGRMDVWNSDFLKSFVGCEGKPFADGVGHLVFNLGIDWFNPAGNMEAKKKWSVGAIYLVCMNLPLATRFLLENVCLVGIIPGPKEPRLTQVNHFLQPLVEQLQSLWNPGVWITKTRNFRNGRLIRAALGAIVADLPAIKKVAGFTSHAHHYFCHYCLLPNDRMDEFDRSVWVPLQRTGDGHHSALRSAEEMVFTGSKTAFSKIGKRVIQELCYRRGLPWNRKKTALLRALHEWVSQRAHVVLIFD